jgi:hypothetical protein
LLQVNANHLTHYQEAARNTAEFLMHNKFTIHNFECHQPVKMSSEKLIKLFNEINWQDGNHFIKSIYLNVYKCNAVPGDNVKLHLPDVIKASDFLKNYGCFRLERPFFQRLELSF